MEKTETQPLNMNINGKLLARVDIYRYRQMFPSRTAAIEFLLQYGLKANPERPAVRKGEK